VRRRATTAGRLDRTVLGTLAAVNVVFVGVYVGLALVRLRYPFELEWYEGQTIDNAYRLLHGLPIYGATDATFAPGYYPPLFYLASLPALVLLGWSLAAPRLVSSAAMAAWGAVTARTLRRAGTGWIAVVLALGTAAAFYPLTHCWYDLARVDALAAALAGIGVALLARDDVQPSARRIAAASVVLVAAVLTKQTVAPVAAAPVVWFALRGAWRRAAVAAGSLALVGTAAAGVAWWWTAGGIAQVYATPAAHQLAMANLVAFGTPLGILAAPFLVVAAAGALAGGRRARTIRFFLLHTTVAALVAALTFAKVGGDSNTAMPAILLLATTTGLAGDALWRALAAAPAGRLVRAGGALALAVLPLLAGALPRDLPAWIPSRADLADVDALWDDMRDVPGDFLAYNYSFVSTVLRGRTYPHGDRLYDLAGGYGAATFRHPDAGRYPAEFLAAIRERRFAAIYTSPLGIPNDPVLALIQERYRPVQVFGGSRFFDPTAAPRWKWSTPVVKWLPRTPVVN
jgi:hypothetical protein